MNQILKILLVFIAYSCSFHENASSSIEFSQLKACSDSLSAFQRLNEVFHKLQSYDDNRKHEGISYQLTTENYLPEDWIIASNPEDKQSRILNKILNEFHSKIITKPDEKHFIDILHLRDLGSMETDEFQDKLIDSISEIIKSAKKEVIIRYLEGRAELSKEGSEDIYFYKSLKKRISVENSVAPVSLYMASVNRRHFFSEIRTFNHAKIIAIDGEYTILGGHNYRGVHTGNVKDKIAYDLSICTTGEAPKYAHEFANFLWTNLVKFDIYSILSYSSNKKITLEISKESFPFFKPSQEEEKKRSAIGRKVPILAVGNLGTWKTFESRTALEEFIFSEKCQPKNTYSLLENCYNRVIYFPLSTWHYSISKATNASIFARSTLLKSVKKNGKIRISQQTLSDTFISQKAGVVLWPGCFLEAISEAILDKNATIEIILSHHSTHDYGDYMGGKAFIKVITDYVTKKLNGNTDSAREVIKNKLSLRQTPENTYNHSKFWMVDDDIFYVGSENIYPAFLQEYGYIIGDKSASADILQTYWSPLWEQSISWED